MNVLDFGYASLEAQLWQIVFLSLRCGAALMAAPMVGGMAVPAPVRILLTAAPEVRVEYRPRRQRRRSAPGRGQEVEDPPVRAPEVGVGRALGDQRVQPGQGPAPATRPVVSTEVRP